MKRFIWFLCIAYLPVLFNSNALAEEQKSTEGTLKWSYSTGGIVYSSPAIGSDGTIYVGSNGTQLWALTSTGALKWIYTTESKVNSSPAIGSDGTIYVGSEDRKLYAINPTGTLKWSYTTGTIFSSPSIGSDGTIYIGADDLKLYAINPIGTLKWNYTTEYYIYSSPAVGADGTIYVGSDDWKLYAVTPTGTSKWSYTTGRSVTSSPAIGSDGTIYVGSQDNKLYAVTPTGTLRWSYTTGGLVNSSPAVGSDGTIYVGSSDSKLYAVTTTGTLKWSYVAGGAIGSCPAIGSDGTIYVGSSDSKLYALTPTGTVKWSYTTGGAIISSPAIGSDGTIYVGSYDGKVYALASSSTGGLASSPWPMFHHDNQHTGNTGTNNTVPSIPVLLSPINGGAGISTSPTLLWNKADGATSYTLQVSQNSSFSSFVFNQAVTDTSKQITGLSEGITYYWRVNALNSDTSSAWSSTWSFTTVFAQNIQTISDGYGDYVLVPSGSFQMGDNFNEGSTGERPVHTVYVDSFYVGKYEVANNEYKAFIDDGSYTTQIYWISGGFGQYGSQPQFWTNSTYRGGGISGNENFPVVGVSWYEAMAYCKWLSVKTGKIYRLPTDAEWEKAARGTDQRRYPWGNTINSSYANYLDSGDPHDNGLTPVGYYDGETHGGFATHNNSSPYGAYDMAGNVWEWCKDWYSDTYYSNSPSINPQGPTTGVRRVIRGGGRTDPVGNLISLFRYDNDPGDRNFNSGIGFRCVREITTPPPSIPILLSPTNGGTGISTSPTLVWNKADGATSYTLQVSQNSSFSSFVFNQALTDTSKQISGLTNSATYYWRVNAINSDTSSGWSSTWSFTTQVSVPSGPVLTSPSNGSTSIATAPTLSWNSSSGANSYTLQISQSSDMSNPVYNQSVGNVTSQQVTGLSNGVPYYWRVNASNAGGTSAWSSTWSFTTQVSPPPTLTLSSPASGSANISTSPTLSWNASGTANSYTLQVSQSSDMSNPVYNQSVGNVTSQQVTGLSNGVIYYWRVNASNAGGTSGWSSTWSFTTQIAIPVAPILTSPSNGSTGIATTPTLSWNSSSGANSYTLQVSQNSDLSTPVFNQSIGNVTSKEITGLAEGTVYYWRVNASNTAGTSGWSTTWNFTTALSPPSAPSLKSPSNGATGISTSPLLEWNASAGATSYTALVSQNNDMSNPVFNQSVGNATSRQVSGLSEGITYYWRVNASNAGGTGVWSASWTFTTVLTPPPAPQLTSPSNGATGIATSPLITWSASAGATSYTLQVSQNGDMSSPVFNQSVGNVTSKQISGLSGGVTYYWRVNASGPGGTSGWSSTWSFTAIITISPPTLVSPEHNAASISTSPTLSWNAATGATSYTLQVSQNSDLSSPLYNQSVGNVTSKQITGLSNGETYYWRVNASGSGGTSAWSGIWSFTTVVSPPLPPALASPANNSTGVSTSPTVSWNASTNAVGYTLQVSQSSDLSSPLFNQLILLQLNQQVTGLSEGVTYFWRVNASNASGTSAWSAIWNFTTKDGTPPAISDLNPGNATIGQEKIITCNVTDNVLVKSVKLYYRQGGSTGDSASFTSITMTKQTGSTYSGTIPVSAITAKGIEFYIEAIDDADNRKTAPEINPVHFPSVLQVTIGSSGITRSGTGLPDIPSGTTNNDFRMISFPIVLNDKNPLSVLGIALGSATYDKTKWRLLQYSGSALSEYPTVPTIQPGYAYWLIVKTANPAIKVTDGLSVPTDVNFTVTIPAGWSQIGNPFNFNVSWNSIKDSTGASNLEPRIWKWTGTSYSTSINALIPWEGYFIFNTTTGTVTLKIPPEEYTGTPKEGDFLKSINPDGWTIQIGAQAGNLEDSDNFAGVSKNASNEHDLLDFSEPPPIGDFVSLYFPHSDWKENARNYAGDFRQLENEGVTWDFVVESSLKEKVDLQFENLDSVPEDMKINLIDMKSITITDLRNENKYSFQPFIGGKKSDTTTSKFKLVIGNDSYIKQVMKDLPKLPEEYLLEQNYPNPFNPITTIRFALPKEGRVSITIYNILGQEVKTVISEQLPAGIHEVIWDGMNNFGQPVASGMYLYCMRAGEKYVQTKKLLLLK